MIRAFLYIVNVLAILFCFALSVSAEDPKVPKDFYDNNYAETPIDKESKTSPGLHDSSPRQIIAPEQDINDSTSDYKLGSSAVDTEKSSLTELTTAMPVKSLGVILNSLDFEHLDQKLSEMLEVAVRYDYRLGYIYTLGDMLNISKIDEDK